MSVGLGAIGLWPTVPPVSSSQADALYCARAFAWGSGANVVLSILEGDTANPVASFESPALTTSGKWTEMDSQGRAHGGNPLTVEVRSTAILDTYCVDDIELWISAGSTCE